MDDIIARGAEDRRCRSVPTMVAGSPLHRTGGWHPWGERRRRGGGGGGGLPIVNVSAFETALSGFAAVTCAVPGDAISAAGIPAVSCVEFMNVVVRLAPFQRTTEPLTKLLPVVVSVKPGPPAVGLLGDSAVRVGGGGGGVDAEPILNTTSTQ